MNILEKLDKALSIEPSEAPKEDQVKANFDSLIKEIKKRFGKDSIVGTEDNGVVLVVRLTKDSYATNQKEFQIPAKQEWIYDKGYALLSIQRDVEPDCVKVYFCTNLTVKV